MHRRSRLNLCAMLSFVISLSIQGRAERLWVTFDDTISAGEPWTRSEFDLIGKGEAAMTDLPLTSFVA